MNKQYRTIHIIKVPKICFCDYSPVSGHIPLFDNARATELERSPRVGVNDTTRLGFHASGHYRFSISTMSAGLLNKCSTLRKK